MMRAKIAVTVDNFVFYKIKDTYKIALVERKNEPFKGHWALPGGFVDQDEDLPDAAKRELQEETGLVVDKTQQIGTFGKPGRDPRGHTISVVYLSQIIGKKDLIANDDAAKAEWFDIKDLPKLAFDHSEIVNFAKQFL